MKMLILLLAIAGVQAAAKGHAQTISLSLNNTPLEKVFKQIEKQTNFSFIYTQEELANTHAVTIQVKNKNLDEVLNLCFKDQPITYSIEDAYIIIKEKKEPAPETIPVLIDVKGKVTSESGEPLVGATVAVKNSDKAVATDDSGNFLLTGIEPNTILLISYVGYESQAVSVKDGAALFIQLRISVSTLDETVTIAYGKTTRRMNTGNVSKVTAEQIEKQPVGNLLSALEGLSSGVIVTQFTGTPGSAIDLQIRGRNSMKQTSQPLYLIDGVPFMLNSPNLSQLSSPIYFSPFSTLNPQDIESVEILKDADATAIYGSQGANGVVLITTKKGSPGKTKTGFNYYNSFGKVTRTMDLLNTQQYVQMRKEAFQNDGVTPTVSNAPDVMIWDTTAYTDWKKFLIGGTARTSSVQASISGGNSATQFLFSMNYYREGVVFPFSDPYQRGSGHLNLSHLSNNKKFKITITNEFGVDEKKLPLNDLSTYIFLPPDAPSMYDSTGKMTWANWVSGTDNPLSQILQKYRNETNSMIAKASFQYEVIKGLNIKTDVGYDFIELNEKWTDPIALQRPSASATGYLSISTENVKNWVIEPQLEYKKVIGSHKLELLAGASWRQTKQDAERTNGTQFTNDDLINNMSAAGQITASNSLSQYRYEAIFGRTTYTYKEKYIANINLRRDGSSRFGPADRFSNFGAIGTAWIFSEEKIIKQHLPFLSYGKLRASYGFTGNDQIGDYNYLDLWSTSSNYIYMGASGLLQTRLFNSTLEWERNKKLEIGFELGFLKDRFLVTTSFYRNRINNQLLPYGLPTQTGFTTILRNIGAVVQNKGWEFELSAKNFDSKYFSWKTNLNISVPRNKLLKYPGLAASSDKLNYIIGYPLAIKFGYGFIGVDPATGVYQLKDIDGNGTVTSPNDLMNTGFKGPDFLGGLQNSLKYKNWQLDILFQFVRQTGADYLSTLFTAPGMIGNQPTVVLDRWQKTGQQTNIERYTSTTTSSAYKVYSQFLSSSANITDASFIRLRNLSLSYSLPTELISKRKINTTRIYVEGQNLLTLTKYKGADPETQSLSFLPPLQVLAFGIQLTF